MKNKKIKCDIYTRVSTTMQVDGYSLDAQKEKLKRYAEFQNMEIVNEYSDEGKSGKSVEGRPEFQRMLDNIENGTDEVQFVLVFKLSRFGRNAADVLNSLQRMQDFGVNLICVEDGIDSSKDSGKMMHNAKKWVMESCIRHGFEQVDLLTKKHRDNYWVEKRLMNKNASDGVGITSNRELIRNTIDKMLPAVDSFEQMVECLKGIYGWNVRVTDKTVTFATSDMKKGIRGNKLGDGYGKAEIVERIAQIVTEREAVNEARSIAEEQAKAKAEAAEREEAIRKKKQIEEERKKAEILSRKRKLAYERNNIQHKYYSVELNRPDWNREYVEYLETQFIRDVQR